MTRGLTFTWWGWRARLAVRHARHRLDRWLDRQCYRQPYRPAAVRWALRWLRQPLGEVLRMPLANWLLGRYPAACWADLCTWSLWGGTIYELRDILDGEGCQPEADEHGTCWCGRLGNWERMEELGYAPPTDAATSPGWVSAATIDARRLAGCAALVPLVAALVLATPAAIAWAAWTILGGRP